MAPHGYKNPTSLHAWNLRLKLTSNFFPKARKAKRFGSKNSRMEIDASLISLPTLGKHHTTELEENQNHKKMGTSQESGETWSTKCDDMMDIYLEMENFKLDDMEIDIVPFSLFGKHLREESEAYGITFKQFIPICNEKKRFMQNNFLCGSFFLRVSPQLVQTN